MGGKKGPEKNRNYEKIRRDRFNSQFTELNELLPDFNSSVIKVTKGEIIGRAIQYLKDTRSKNQKLENEFENEKNKISELQKKVAGLLQIIKELVKLLHKSNINFPSSLPVEDFVSFKEAYLKCKRKSTESSVNESKKKKTDSINDDDKDALTLSEADSSDGETEKAPPPTEKSSSSSTVTRSENQSSPPISAMSVPMPSVQNVGSPQVMNLDTPVLRLNSNPFVLPQGNLVAVNGLQNTMLNNVNNSPTILINKPMTVPTFILMQNNFVPVSTVSQITLSQRSQKLIVPKMTVNTTKTTFINKKPIPAVRLYKSSITAKDNPHKAQKRKRSRRSKGILVKYPKRKPPTKGKKREAGKKSEKKLEAPNADEGELGEKNENVDSFPALQPCNVENSYTESADVIKTYPDHLFDSQDIQATGQFIDFFENSSTRSIDNADANVGAEFVENSGMGAEKEKGIESFSETAFVSTSLNCGLMEPVSKTPVKERENLASETEKSLYLPSSSSSDPLLLKYVPSANCDETAPVVETGSRDENAVLDKRKSDKELAPLTIQCNLENKSIPKDLNLSFDDKKHYESSFDEFSSDLFTSLQVPSSGQNTDSISPTAAFLLTFPVVSSCKNADLLPDHEEDSNTATATSTTILQIGNLESPSTLLFTNKHREGKDAEKVDESFSTYCNSASELEREKKKECKETPRDVFNFDVFANQPAKNACSKEPNMTFYPTSSSSAFPSYNIFTKYNEIPAVTSSYYSFGSQPFTKSVDPTADFNSWVPSVYGQEEAGKEKTKRDKCTSTGFRNTFGLPPSEPTDKAKAGKKAKHTNSRPLVNWMTSPDLRNAPDTAQSLTDVFAMPKDDSAGNAFLNSPNVQNSSNFASYPSADYYLENQNYADPQLSSCKIAYSSANPTNYSWSPAKSSLPTLPLETRNMIIPSTLPTLVGDLALGTNSFNNYDLISKKYDVEKKKDPCKNYYKPPPQNAATSGSFLSVTQLVDDKAEKPMPKKALVESCPFEEARDKCYKENFGVNKNAENVAEYKKGYSTCKDTAKSQGSLKCKKDAAKFNASRCVSKENKKDTNRLQKFNDYSAQSCQLLNKDVNPLSNKNSNYSAESLISSSHSANVCSSQNYFSYDNSSNYNNCSNKRAEETDSLANMGYYANTNYVYHNNFQTFNNYGFSNQCYNNYSSQVQPGGFQKKKDENQQAKQDADWYKESLTSYNTIVPSEFPTNQKEKCKQTFANKYNHGQKNTINSGVYNNYYQYGSAASSVLNHTKSSCSFSSTYSFSQAGQQCLDTSCQTPGYEKSSRNLAMNANSVHPATTLTNFNLSTIFPEINDKHCVPNRVNTVVNEKTDPKYGAAHKAGNMDEMNYNYMLQPTAMDNNSESASVYGSSGFQISHFTDFTSKKVHK